MGLALKLAESRIINRDLPPSTMDFLFPSSGRPVSIVEQAARQKNTAIENMKQNGLM